MQACKEIPNSNPGCPLLRRSLDYMLGYLLFGGLFLLSFLGFVSRIQAALLFNVKFAKSLKRGRLLVSCVHVGCCCTAMRLQKLPL